MQKALMTELVDSLFHDPETPKEERKKQEEMHDTSVFFRAWGLGGSTVKGKAPCSEPEDTLFHLSNNGWNAPSFWSSQSMACKLTATIITRLLPGVAWLIATQPLATQKNFINEMLPPVVAHCHSLKIPNYFYNKFCLLQRTLCSGKNFIHKSSIQKSNGKRSMITMSPLSQKILKLWVEVVTMKLAMLRQIEETTENNFSIFSQS